MSVGNVFSSEIVNVYFYARVCVFSLACVSGLHQFVCVVLTRYPLMLGFRDGMDRWVLKLECERKMKARETEAKESFELAQKVRLCCTCTVTAKCCTLTSVNVHFSGSHFLSLTKYTYCLYIFVFEPDGFTFFEEKEKLSALPVSDFCLGGSVCCCRNGRCLCVCVLCSFFPLHFVLVAESFHKSLHQIKLQSRKVFPFSLQFTIDLRLACCTCVKQTAVDGRR